MAETPRDLPPVPDPVAEGAARLVRSGRLQHDMRGTLSAGPDVLATFSSPIAAADVADAVNFVADQARPRPAISPETRALLQRLWDSTADPAPRPEPEYAVYSAEDVLRALDLIREQHLAGEPLVWTGPDRLHPSVSAVCPPPSHQFSPENLAYEQENGGGFWTVYNSVALQIGVHNGAVRTEQEPGRRRD